MMSLVDVANKTDYNTTILTKNVSLSVTSFFIELSNRYVQKNFL